MLELENQNCNIDCHWVKAHAGNHGNELAKEAVTSTENESYKKLPEKYSDQELNDGSLINWQNEWDKAIKGQITKDFSQ
jgi:ribonuclease HI